MVGLRPDCREAGVQAELEVGIALIRMVGLRLTSKGMSSRTGNNVGIALIRMVGLRLLIELLVGQGLLLRSELP